MCSFGPYLLLVLIVLQEKVHLFYLGEMRTEVIKKKQGGLSYLEISMEEEKEEPKRPFNSVSLCGKENILSL